MKTKLSCNIVRTPHDDCEYVVTDKDGLVVATGISSSPDWVKHDAGGYHTKEEFDKLYPNGWEVIFNFKS